MPDKSFELKILLFASLKERVGKNQILIQVVEGSNLSTFLHDLLSQHPELEPFSRNMIVAVNQKFADTEQVIQRGDEIALFPPVSGG